VLARAESDLRKALSSSHGRSDSYAALSGVMFAQGKYAESFVYARRAYDSNVFLRRDVEILNRLFNAALHGGDDQAADEWCKQLQKEYARAWPAVMCRINLAGFAPNRVSIATLEREIENMDGVPQRRQMMEPRLKGAYAISLAQLGMSDSARSVLRSLESNTADTELLILRAFALAALEDAPQAHATLRRYLSEFQGTRSNALNMRWLH
jgi:hypothetical protein